jgi:transposase-like protein
MYQHGKTLSIPAILQIYDCLTMPAKRHLRKFNGVPKEHFNLFLKECEWRFNIGTPSEQLKDLKTLLKELY